MAQIKASLHAGDSGRVAVISLEGVPFVVTSGGQSTYTTLHFARREDAEAMLQAAARAVALLDPATPLSVASGVSPSAPVPLCPPQEPEGGVSAGETSSLRMALAGE